jgi:WD40 repeat protein
VLLTLKGHTGAVYSASFSADGWWIQTESADGTAKVWDARPVSGELLPKAPPLPPQPPN